MLNDIEIYSRKLKSFGIEKNKKWGIYGQGDGAKIVYQAMKSLLLDQSILCIIDQDEKVTDDSFFYEIPVRRISDVLDCIDGIIIAAKINYDIIYNRLKTFLMEKEINTIKLINIFGYISVEEQQEYLSYIECNVLRKNDTFIEFSDEEYQAEQGDTKVIAWYLPQFHQMEINNQFHGQGFTEWSNTSRCIPMFTGHYQPHIPFDVGYYDLLNIDTFKRQIYLAKRYGIYGFCFHYYWFSGTRIMEKPLEFFLWHKELDMPFCLDWATENWTALWDGGKNDVMLEQKLEKDDDDRFMQDILPYMKDKRYIKIGGRPILVIYRPNVFEKGRFCKLLQNFRNIAKREGFPDLFIMFTNSFGFEERVEEWGGDALVEFPPWGVTSRLDVFRPSGYINPYFKGVIRDASSYIKNKRYLLPHSNKKVFRSALTSWDNTARKMTTNCSIICGLTPDTFKQWVKDIIDESHKIHSSDENIIFVNSWNEWAEGSHLEPDMKYGYAWLEALKNAIEECRIIIE